MFFFLGPLGARRGSDGEEGRLGDLGDGRLLGKGNASRKKAGRQPNKEAAVGGTGGFSNGIRRQRKVASAKEKGCATLEKRNIAQVGETPAWGKGGVRTEQ